MDSSTPLALAHDLIPVPWLRLNAAGVIVDLGPAAAAMLGADPSDAAATSGLIADPSSAGATGRGRAGAGPDRPVGPVGRSLSNWLGELGPLPAISPNEAATGSTSARASSRPRGTTVLRSLPLIDDNRRVFVDLSMAPLPDGTVMAWLTDVTARTEAEAEVARLRARLADAERQRARLATIQRELSTAVAGTGDGERDEMVGESAGLRRVRDQAERVASTASTVLIHGETGSGKELVARLIHLRSGLQGAFVPVNCAALPESLIESELFGHERGAFTGADRRRLGKFELADGGTLFLDEIAELPVASQAKLLRVIQDGTFERVGGAETVRVSVRLIAATHRDLARQVERQRFREDLFYRLNVFRIEVPPLRERRDDLRMLATRLHQRLARRMARPVLPISERSLRRLLSYDWPGNVRELANAVERATLLADGPELEIEIPESPDLRPLAGEPPRAVAPGSQATTHSSTNAAQRTRDILLDLTIEQLQRLHITHALESCDYRVFGDDGAAARLDINPNTLLSRMDKFGIPRPRQVRRRTRP